MAVFLISLAPVAADQIVILRPSKDNTLYQTPPDQGDRILERSNGRGRYLFVGRTGLDAGFRLRKGLLAFDMASQVPPNVAITFAELTLYQSKAAPGTSPTTITLHKLLAGWGEGESNAFGPEGQGDLPASGDATWMQTFYGSEPPLEWKTPGGDYESTLSSSSTVGSVLGAYVFPCTAQLIADVQHWLDQPTENFGWLLNGESGAYSAHRFNSRENDDPLSQPRLQLAYRSADSLHSDGSESSPDCQ